MDAEIAGRVAKSVKTLRQSSTVFRALGIIAVIGAFLAGLSAATAAGDADAAVAAGTGMPITLYGIGAAIGCFAVSALFDGLASITEVLAARAG